MEACSSNVLLTKQQKEAKPDLTKLSAPINMDKKPDNKSVKVNQDQKQESTNNKKKKQGVTI